VGRAVCPHAVGGDSGGRVGNFLPFASFIKNVIILADETDSDRYS
jgi:hypothetical protein